MTVKELREIVEIDTNVIVRDKADGHWLKKESEYNDKVICGMYAKAHRCGNPPKMRAEIVVYVK